MKTIFAFLNNVIAIFITRHLMTFLTSLIRSVVDIRRGEKTKTLLMFCYFFLAMAMNYILKPVQKSLFLAEFGAHNLRYAYIGEGLFLIFTVSGYVWFAKRASPKKFYYGILTFFIGNLFLFWFLFRLELPYLSAFFYFWVASFPITLTTVFWTLANEIFNPDEAKRLFGFIISGGSVGGILGGILTNQSVRWMKSEDLLLIVAGMVILCLALITQIWKNIDAHTAAPSGGTREEEKVKIPPDPTSRRSVLRLFLGSSYLGMLAAVVLLSKMSSTVIDNQFTAAVEQTVIGREAVTAFFGGFSAWLNGLSFLMQLLLTSLSLRYLGVGFSLLILPAGLAATGLVSFLVPVLSTALVFRLYDGSVSYSIQQASKEVLYLPLPNALRRRVKPVIDMLGFRFAKTFAGLYIALFAPLLGLSDMRLGLLVLILLPVWFFVAVWMKRSYAKLLRDHLMNRRQYEKALEAKRATDVLSFLHDEKDFEGIRFFMDHHSSYTRKLAAAACMAYDQGGRDLDSARRVAHDLARPESYERIRAERAGSWVHAADIQFLVNLLAPESEKNINEGKSAEDYLKDYPPAIWVKLGEVLRDPEKALEIKRMAVRILEFIPAQEAVNLLTEMLGRTEDHAFRYVILKALNRLRDRKGELTMEPSSLKSEVFQETRIHEKIQKLHYFYERFRKAKRGEDYLEITLKAMLEESLERLFLCLKLLYPDEVVREIYKKIVSETDEDSSKPHALEFLNHLLEPDIRIPVNRVLASRAYYRLKEKEVVEILKNFVASEDPWFSLMARFYISETKFTKTWLELVGLGKGAKR